MESHKESQHKIDLTQVFRAHQLFSQDDFIVESALMHSEQLSKSFEAEILLKREDSQKGEPVVIQEGPSRSEEPTSSTWVRTSTAGRKATSSSQTATSPPATQSSRASSKVD